MKIKLLLVFVSIFFFSSATFHTKGQTIRSQVASQGTPEKDLVIFPNPARENINLKVTNPNVKLKSVTIYALIGMQVAEFTNLNQNSVDLRIDRLKPGKYFVKYTLSNNTQQVAQLIKE